MLSSEFQLANLSWPTINAAICIYSDRKQEREREKEGEGEREREKKKLSFLFGTLHTLLLQLFYLRFLFECNKKLAGELVDRHLSEFVCCPSCHKSCRTRQTKEREGRM